MVSFASSWWSRQLVPQVEIGARRPLISPLYTRPSMMTLVAVIHVIVCLLLIALVLLQDPKNAGVGSMFGGGSSNALLGATGATTFLTRLTRWAAVIFGVCALLLTLMSRPKTGSVMDAVAPVVPPAPVEKAVPPAAPTDAKAPADAKAPVENKAPAQQPPQPSK